LHGHASTHDWSAVSTAAKLALPAVGGNKWLDWMGDIGP
jgi:hypothetical protein